MVSKTWFHILILIAIGYVLFFFRLGSNDFIYAEAREGQVVLEMYKTGNIILPLRVGKVIPSKPPFFHWIGLIVSKVTGSVNEFSTRFPSALFGILGMIVTYFLGKEIFNTRVGLLSSIFMATTTGYMKLARQARVDMTLNFFMTLSILFFILGYKYEYKRKLFFLLYFLSASLATLAKGPVGIVLPSIIVIIFLIAKKELGMIFKKEILLGILIFIVVSSSWYILALIIGGEEFFQKQIMTENINRFIGRKHGYGHEHPFYYLLPRVFTFQIPWSIFLPAVIYNYFKTYSRERQNKATFFIIWFFTVLIFFSIAASKRTDYLLPIFPAGGILIAALWDNFLLSQENKSLNKLMKVSIFSFPVIGILAPVLIILALFLNSFGITIPLLFRNFMKHREFVKTSFYCSLFYSDYVFDLVISVCSILVAIYTIWLINKKRWKASLYSLIAFSFVLMNIAFLKYFPVYGGDLFVKDFAMEVNKSISQEDQLYFYNLDKNHQLKRKIFNGLVFYTSRHLKNLTDLELSKLKLHDPSIYLITEEKYFNSLTNQGFKILIEKKSKLIDFQFHIFLVKLITKNT